jgi:signal transduction histidine kinase
VPSKLPTPPSGTPIVSAPIAEEKAKPTVSARGTRENVPEKMPRIDDVNERIALIAHDLKTPLSIIMLEAQLLGDKLPLEQLPAVQHSLERISLNAAYIDRLIADLLDLASLEAGQLQLRIERVELPGLLRETVERAVSTVDRNRVSVEIRSDCAVRADRYRLERVIANLISNALKYSAALVHVTLDEIDGRARVTVVDQGRGLSPEQISTVFDRYRRVANTRGREGYGLGLYISRKIIDAHSGKIGVASVVGQGSQFFFEIDTIA